MAKLIYPIVKLPRDDAPSFPLALEEIFEAANVKMDDQFTYTTRYSIDWNAPDAAAKVEALRKQIRAELEPAEAEQFISFMDANDWDVSFLVDTY